MAGNASISGLASGLDTATIISQLMQLETIPQSRLKTQITTHQSAVTKLQDLNTKLAALATKAADLAKAAGWSPVTASSSYDKVSLTTSAGAAPGELSFTVVATAKAHLVSFDTTATLDQVVVSDASGNISIDMLDGNVQTLNTGDGTLQSVVNAINSSTFGLRASTVKLDNGTYRLRVEATQPGAAGDFNITEPDGTPLLGGATVVTAGNNAAIKIGADTLSSPSNTFSDILPGLSITLSPDAVLNTSVIANLATDSKLMTGAVKGLVDSLNAILSDIDAATALGGSAGGRTGVLAGDSRLRTLRDQLVGTLYSSAGAGLSTVGIQLDKTGKFVFNETTFNAAYQADPGKTAASFISAATDTGFSDRLAIVTKQASRPTDGVLSTVITGRKSTIDQLEDSVANWDIRLELRRTTLTRQFTALETALGRMNSQSNWLAGQISSLPTSSS